MQYRPYRGIDRGGHTAFVLPVFRKQFVPRGDVVVRPNITQDFDRSAFVVRVCVGMQEVHDDGFATEIEQLRCGFLDGFFIEIHDHAAGGIHAFRHFQTQIAGHDRFEPSKHAVWLRPGAPADLDDVTKPLGRDHPGARKLPFQNCVGRRRGAVDDGIDFRKRCARLRECREYAIGLVFDCRRRLDDFDAIIRDEQEVGKRAADIDAGNNGLSVFGIRHEEPQASINLYVDKQIN